MRAASPGGARADAQHDLAALRRALLVEGIDLSHYRESYLERRLRASLVDADLPLEAYIARLVASPAARQEFLEELGVNVTSFWRDPPVWDFLEAHVIPQLVDEAGPRGVRAASVGCAAGQEAYGIAMILAEETQTHGGAPRVAAFDIDPEALALARAGEYTHDDLDAVSDAAKARYFLPTARGHQVAPALRRLVTFKQVDAIGGPIGTGYDLVLCRNLLIYLDPAAKTRLVRKLFASLRPRGVLVVGQTDSIGLPLPAGVVQLHQRLRVYRRGGDRHGDP